MKLRMPTTAAALALLAAPLATAPLLASEPAAAGTEVPGKAMYGAWGVDTAGGDPAAKPGDDFFRHTAGKWYDSTEIPADRSAIGAFDAVFDRTTAALNDIIAKAPRATRHGGLYTSFMDEKRIEAVGLAPLRRDLAAIAAIKTKAQFARAMGQTNGSFGISLFDPSAGADTATPEINVLYLGQGGLGLPEREYYFSPQFEKQRSAYRAYIERTMRMIGNPDPKKAADTIMGFETEVAFKSWKIADRRNIDKVNNPMSSAELAAYAPGVDWPAYFAGVGVPPQGRIIVLENTAIRALAQLHGETPLATLKLWQQFHTAYQAAPYLNKAMVDSRFEFIRTLSGASQIRPRWQRAVNLVNTQLGELVGQDYVRQHFPAASKTKMEALVGNLKQAMAGRIRGNDWMSDATKAAALDKLARMDVLVGYPDKWRSFGGLQINPADLYGNLVRAGRFNAAYQMSELGKKVDRRKWGINPQEVNAFNGFLENKIVFPAGILQAPFFDPNADDAVNYGAIGAVIGHEISHGFDDQGRKADAQGKIRDWWGEEDSKRFEARAKVLGAQFAKYEPLPGVTINPELTMGENIADLAGLTIALDAYRASLGGRPAPVIDGYSGEQRVFLGWAQGWRSKFREDQLRQLLASDTHSPSPVRAFAPLRNIDAWYDAFGVKEGDKHYIAPADRARIW
jgi:putative endopeptidase